MTIVEEFQCDPMLYQPDKEDRTFLGIEHDDPISIPWWEAKITVDYSALSAVKPWRYNGMDAAYIALRGQANFIVVNATYDYLVRRWKEASIV